jgi:uncharacterized membrane protein
VLTFRTIILWIHLSAAVVWVGGMIVVPFIVLPAARQMLGEKAQAFVEAIVRRFQRFSRELILVIFVTGVLNFVIIGVMTRFAYGGTFLQLVIAKFILFGAMAANQAWYSLHLVPASSEMERWAVWSAVVNAALAALVFFLALRLRFG